MKSEKSPGHSRINRLVCLTLAFFVLMVLISGIVYLMYGGSSGEHDARWYNFSFVSSPEVMLVIQINTTGPQHVTVLNSSSDMACISMHCVPGPSYYLLKENENGTVVEFRLNNTFGGDSAKVDTFVYLPHGCDYQMLLSGKDLYYNPGKIVNEYGRGHLTINIIDGQQHVRMQNYW